MAIKVARSLVSQNFLEQINLSSTYGIIELYAPRTFINKSLADIGLRKKMHVSVLAIRRGDDIIVAPGPDEKILHDDVLVVLGSMVQFGNNQRSGLIIIGLLKMIS
jgi:trk system potassium uptake protein TrkA